MLKGIHALVLGGLCIFKNNITEYIYTEGAYARIRDGLYIFTNDVECIDKVGLHVPVMARLVLNYIRKQYIYIL
jgi:hypothetical protein